MMSTVHVQKEENTEDALDKGQITALKLNVSFLYCKKDVAPKGLGGGRAVFS